MLLQYAQGDFEKFFFLLAWEGANKSAYYDNKTLVVGLVPATLLPDLLCVRGETSDEEVMLPCRIVHAGNTPEN